MAKNRKKKRNATESKSSNGCHPQSRVRRETAQSTNNRAEKPKGDKSMVENSMRKKFMSRVANYNCDGDLSYSEAVLKQLLSEGHEFDFKNVMTWLQLEFECDCDVLAWNHANFPQKGFCFEEYDHAAKDWKVTRRLEPATL